MFITISIHSKNLNSLTSFLKFFYKLKMNKTFKLKFYVSQSQKKKKFSFFSTLQSPHVNKKSQEQFEYSVYSKKFKIQVSQITKFLITWKTIKTMLFSDINIKTEFWLNNKTQKYGLSSKIDFDKFKLRFLKVGLKPRKRRFAITKTPKSKKVLSNVIGHTSLKLLDTHGEILIKNFLNV